MPQKLKPVHPGQILQRQYLTPMNMSVRAVARAIFVPPSRVDRVVNGKRPVTGDLALRFGKFLKTTPQFWMNIQVQYDLETASDKLGKALDRIRPCPGIDDLADQAPELTEEFFKRAKPATALFKPTPRRSR